MHQASRIRQWLATLPTAGQEDDMFGRDTRNTPTPLGSTPTPLGGQNDRLRRDYARRVEDVRRNGVNSRSANSPRSNRRPR